jgi:hypothetical protein
MSRGNTRRSYAVLWAVCDDVWTGRLEPYGDRFELRGAEVLSTVPFASVVHAAIARGPTDRLRGLPVLRLELRGGTRVSIASLEGAGTLHELADRVGVPAAA